MTDWEGRDLADEATGAPRTEAPQVLLPIDENAPVSGHRPPPEMTIPGADAPEHDWSAAKGRVFPLLRPSGTPGMPIGELDTVVLDGTTTRTEPIVVPGPAGLSVVFGLAAEGFAVLVNAEHVRSWGVSAAELESAAMANLTAWSRTAEWIEEHTDDRRLLSSSTGDGYDAARVLLPEARARIAELAANAPAGTRVLVGTPERDLLVAGRLVPGDEEFAALFRDFLAEQSAAGVEPLDDRILELRGDELVEFAG